MQLLKPAAAQRYAAEVQYDPKQQAQLSLGTFCTVTGARAVLPEVVMVGRWKACRRARRSGWFEMSRACLLL